MKIFRMVLKYVTLDSNEWRIAEVVDECGLIPFFMTHPITELVQQTGNKNKPGLIWTEKHHILRNSVLLKYLVIIKSLTERIETLKDYQKMTAQKVQIVSCLSVTHSFKLDTLKTT